MLRILRFLPPFTGGVSRSDEGGLRRRDVWTPALAAAACLLPVFAPAPVSAHHSFAMFDTGKQTTVQGVVKQFTWANPHVWLDIVVTGDNGQAQTWGLESLAVGLLYRDGWTADSLKPGDKVTVLLHPMRDGSNGGQLMKVTLPDGRVLNSGGGRP